MGERKLETITEVDRRVFIYDFSMGGFALRFVSGPEIANGPQRGDWLDRWETHDGKQRFGFGKRRILFTTKEAAGQVQAELRKAVDIITEIVE